MRDRLDRAVDANNTLDGGRRLALADRRLIAEKLAVQVVVLEDVAVDDVDRPHSHSREPLDHVPAQPPCPDDDDSRFEQPPLSAQADGPEAAKVARR